MPALRELLETTDIDAMLAKLAAMNIRPHVSGWNDKRSFTVMDREFPEAMRERAIQAARNDDGWNGFFDRKE